MHGKATRPGKRTLEIDRAQFEAFLTELERDLLTDPCDHTLRRSIAWAQHNGVNVRDFVGLLEEHGGFCDDEVLYNVDPDEVF
jgi:hypothetical protein